MDEKDLGQRFGSGEEDPKPLFTESSMSCLNKSYPFTKSARDLMNKFRGEAMFKKILFPTDFSEKAKTELRLYYQYSRDWGSYPFSCHQGTPGSDGRTPCGSGG